MSKPGKHGLESRLALLETPKQNVSLAVHTPRAGVRVAMDCSPNGWSVYSRGEEGG